MTDSGAFDDLHAVIPAGGSGTRLWPLSRRDRPKFLLDLTGSGRSLLQQTWDRMAQLVAPERIHVITGLSHASAVAEQLPDLSNLLVEPEPRDSMPAIALAAAVIHAEHPEALVGSFAADHLIEDAAGFAAAASQAAVAARSGRLATIGIEPTGPSTAFGYIESGMPLGLPAAPDARAVVRFVEKPDEATASHYLARGGFSWNAGMFIVRADVLLDHLARLQPLLYRGVLQIAAAWHTDDRDEALTRVWPTLTRIAIGHAVAEPVSLAGGMAVVPGRFDWNDIGDFTALSGIRAAARPDGTMFIDADGLVLGGGDIQVAVVGVRDVVVVRTADALLVTTGEHAQRVRDVPAALRAAGREDLV